MSSDLYCLEIRTSGYAPNKSSRYAIEKLSAIYANHKQPPRNAASLRMHVERGGKTKEGDFRNRRIQSNRTILLGCSGRDGWLVGCGVGNAVQDVLYV